MTTPIRDTQIPGENANPYEAGVKSTLFDRKLLLNATLFYQSFTNFQLNTFTGSVRGRTRYPTSSARASTPISSGPPCRA